MTNKAKLFIVGGDIWHPMSTLKTCLQFLNRRFELHYQAHIDLNQLALLPQCHAVIIAKANHQSEHCATPWMSQNLAQGLKHYVQTGGRLIFLHSGLVEYDKHKEVVDLAGGFFTHHPDQCSTELIHLDHLSPSKIPNITIHDEHYFVTLTSNAVQVFLESRSEYGNQPAAWYRTYGQGVVVSYSPAHTPLSWQNVHLQHSFESLLSLSSRR